MTTIRLKSSRDGTQSASVAECLLDHGKPYMSQDTILLAATGDEDVPVDGLRKHLALSVPGGIESEAPAAHRTFLSRAIPGETTSPGTGGNPEIKQPSVHHLELCWMFLPSTLAAQDTAESGRVTMRNWDHRNPSRTISSRSGAFSSNRELNAERMAKWTLVHSSAATFVGDNRTIRDGGAGLFIRLLSADELGGRQYDPSDLPEGRAGGSGLSLQVIVTAFVQFLAGGGVQEE